MLYKSTTEVSRKFYEKEFEQKKIINWMSIILLKLYKKELLLIIGHCNIKRYIFVFFNPFMLYKSTTEVSSRYMRKNLNK